MDYRRKHLRDQGFTLVEMLIVIGVLAVLIGIAVFGFRVLERGSRQKQTKAALANAASLFAEYEKETALHKQPNDFWKPDVVTKLTTGFDFWKDADPDATGVQQLQAPTGSMDVDDNIGPDFYREKSQAIRNTAVLMRQIETLPAAQRILSQLPSDATMNVYEDVPGHSILIGRVLLDGWNNPIIFVPAMGLGGVRIGDPTDLRDRGLNPYVVRSNKIYPATDASLITNVTPPNARPFFASAGPDGVFGGLMGPDGRFGTDDDIFGGNDNEYSFEN